MVIYLDTSSLVKLYVEEEDSPKIADFVESSHLFSAVTLHKEISTPIIFSCSDQKLQKASQVEGMRMPE
ncbi:MAG: hypothetical protein JRJ77_10080 [Deltaproteobacteria bacterium]|nr:hypothetical protein [Deltaproteobacteria bacterium]MBW2339148.1 hypothetical protein [Deltaproteobacteria bacterium]